MRKVELTLPEFMFVVGTRAMLAAGIALVVANRFTRGQRKVIGATLTAIGGISTIPAIMAVFPNIRNVEPEPAAASTPDSEPAAEPQVLAPEKDIEAEAPPVMPKTPRRRRAPAAKEQPTAH